jgi:uncharacterized membrane protein YhaH (DUF805 family)
VDLFSTHGRTNRAPYFWHTLLDGFVVVFLLFLLTGGTVGLMSIGADGGGVIPILATIAWFGIIFAAFLAELCITIRRFHDLDRSGWQWLLSFIPLVNIYIWFLLLFEPGTNGPNRYGEDPLGRDENLGR